MAEQLFVSPHTVSSHLRSIFGKLGVNSRVALTRLATENDRAPIAGRLTPAVAPAPSDKVGCAISCALPALVTLCGDG